MSPIFFIGLNILIIIKFWKKNKFISVFLILVTFEISRLSNLYWKLGSKKLIYILTNGTTHQKVLVFTPNFMDILFIVLSIILSYIFYNFIRMLPGGLFFSWFKDEINDKSFNHQMELNEMKQKNEFQIDKKN